MFKMRKGVILASVVVLCMALVSFGVIILSGTANRTFLQEKLVQNILDEYGKDSYSLETLQFIYNQLEMNNSQ